VHDSDSFVSEVSEEVRRDRLFAALRRYGWLIAALVVLIVGGAAYYEWRKLSRQAAAQAAGDALRAAYAAPDAATRAGLLAEVADDGSVPELYRALAALERVMLLGDAMAASERQATIETLAAPGAPFRPLALEQRALMHLDAGDREAAIADLEALLEEPGATEALRGRAQQLIVAAGGTLPTAGSADG
jgi:hypothetical protein